MVCLTVLQPSPARLANDMDVASMS